MMRDRLAIPYIGPKDNVYGMVFRCIKSHNCGEAGCPKYLAPEGDRRMFNTRALAAPTDYLLVAEGELDAATLTVCGWPAVGIPGANAWRPHYSRMFAGFSKVILLQDADVRKDPDKQTAAEKLASAFRRALPSSGSVILCEMEGARDANEVFVKHGKEGLQSLLKGEEDDE